MPILASLYFDWIAVLMRPLLYFVLLLLFTATHLISNPNSFANLGNPIYDNVQKIKQLKRFEAYRRFEKDIDSFVQLAKETKQLGYLADKEQNLTISRRYLKQLRRLAQKKDFYERSVESIFKKALRQKDYELVMDLLQTGLIDFKRYKRDLLEFCEENKGAFKPRGILKEWLKHQNIDTRNSKTKEDIYEIRQKDEIRQMIIQKKLERGLQDSSR